MNDKHTIDPNTVKKSDGIFSIIVLVLATFGADYH